MVGGLRVPNFKTFHGAAVTKPVQYRCKGGHMYQRDGIDSLEISLYIFGQLIFNKGAKAIQWGNGQPYQQTVVGKLYIYMQSQM